MHVPRHSPCYTLPPGPRRGEWGGKGGTVIILFSSSHIMLWKTEFKITQFIGKVDNAIYQINRHPANGTLSFDLTFIHWIAIYLLDNVCS